MTRCVYCELGSAFCMFFTRGNHDYFRRKFVLQTKSTLWFFNLQVRHRYCPTTGSSAQRLTEGEWSTSDGRSFSSKRLKKKCGNQLVVCTIEWKFRLDKNETHRRVSVIVVSGLFAFVLNQYFGFLVSCSSRKDDRFGINWGALPEFSWEVGLHRFPCFCEQWKIT
jgi:hypothetical protein